MAIKIYIYSRVWLNLMEEFSLPSLRTETAPKFECYHSRYFCIACKTSVGWTCCGSGSYFLVKITSMISQIFTRWVLMMSFAFVSITCCRVLQSWAVHIPNQSYQSMQHTDYGLAVKKMFFSKGSLDSVGKWIVYTNSSVLVYKEASLAFIKKALWDLDPKVRKAWARTYRRNKTK